MRATDLLKSNCAHRRLASGRPVNVAMTETYAGATDGGAVSC
jgi:hypothetical protein